MRYFISGHRDITNKEFQRYYAKIITNAVMKEPNAEFVVGDYYGVDAVAQDYLANLKATYKDIKVTVYHMFTDPRNNIHQFPTCGGYENDHTRDCAMTINSDTDIAWVRSGKKNSGTEQNLIRRKIKNTVHSLNYADATDLVKSLSNILDTHPGK